MSFTSKSLTLLAEIAVANESVSREAASYRQLFSGTPPNTSYKDAAYRSAMIRLMRSVEPFSDLKVAGLPSYRGLDNLAELLAGAGLSAGIESAHYVGFEREAERAGMLRSIYGFRKPPSLSFDLHQGEMIAELSKPQWKDFGFSVLDFDLMECLARRNGSRLMERIVSASYNCVLPGELAIVLVNDTMRGSPPGVSETASRKLEVLAPFVAAWNRGGFTVTESDGERYNGGGGPVWKWWFLVQKLGETTAQRLTRRLPVKTPSRLPTKAPPPIVDLETVQFVVRPFSEPVSKPAVKSEGKTFTVAEMASELKISEQSVRKRLALNNCDRVGFRETGRPGRPAPIYSKQSFDRINL